MTRPADVAQASSEITWGEAVLDALESGASPTEALAPYARGDTQLAVIGFDGRLAVHTGESCDPNVDHASATGVSCQVNTAAMPRAAHLMLEAFAATAGPLAERMVAALGASGGDARGQQGAGLLVTGLGPLRGFADEPHIDLRVDDHRSPVEELARLLRLHRAHCTMRLAHEFPPDQRLHVLAPLVEAHPDDPHLLRALAAAQHED